MPRTTDPHDRLAVPLTDEHIERAKARVAGQFCGRVHAPHVEATARRYKLTPEQAAAAIADALRGTCNTPCNGPIRKEPRK